MSHPESYEQLEGVSDSPLVVPLAGQEPLAPSALTREPQAPPQETPPAPPPAVIGMVATRRLFALSAPRDLPDDKVVALRAVAQTFDCTLTEVTDAAREQAATPAEAVIRADEAAKESDESEGARYVQQYHELASERYGAHERLSASGFLEPFTDEEQQAFDKKGYGSVTKLVSSDCATRATVMIHTDEDSPEAIRVELDHLSDTLEHYLQRRITYAVGVSGGQRIWQEYKPGGRSLLRVPDENNIMTTKVTSNEIKELVTSLRPLMLVPGGRWVRAEDEPS